MLLQQFTSAKRQISSESFVFQPDSALVHKVLEASNFLANNFTKMLTDFKNSFSSKFLKKVAKAPITP